MLSLMTAALGATSCFEGEEGWVASPEGRCYRLTQPVSSLRACIAECGAGAGVLVAPDYTQCVKDPESGKPSCAIEDRKTDGEAAKLDWVNKYIRYIFGEDGRKFEPAAAA